jgi:RND family efflux transporter MFP subunit
MNPKINLPLLLVALTAYACSEDSNNETDKLKSELNETIAQIEDLNKKKFTLEVELSKIDSSFRKNELNAVTFVMADTSDFVNFVEVQGNIEADKNVLLNAEMSGVINKILVQEGQHVRKGQTLLYIDTEILNKNIEEVKKSLELAQFVFEKQENLHKQNIGSELQYREAKNNKERLEQTLQTLETQKSKAIVTAPFDGYIEKVMVEEGSMAMPQVPLLRIIDMKKIKIETDVMETYLRTVHKDRKADIYIRALDTTIYDAAITFVGKYINPANRTFRIQIALNNYSERILPNLVALVRIKNEKLKNVLTIPNECILQSNTGKNYVYVIKDENGKHIARKVDIETGPSDDTHTVVLENLKPGDKVVLEGARGIKNGMELTVRK